jgi:glycosyltransferase involved in cell wall biosynthesis
MKIFPFLHSGRALLATDLPTHTQILTPDVARLADPEPEAFARALAELCADSAERERLGMQGREFVEGNHTFEAHQRRVDSLYQVLADTLPIPSSGGADPL